LRKSKRHAYCYSNSYGHSHSDSCSHSYGDSHSDGDSNSYGDANTDAYGYGNSDLNADSNTGETITDGEAATNNTAAETIVGNITNWYVAKNNTCGGS